MYSQKQKKFAEILERVFTQEHRGEKNVAWESEKEKLHEHLAQIKNVRKRKTAKQIQKTN